MTFLPLEALEWGARENLEVDQSGVLGVLILKQENCALCDAAEAMLDRLSGEYPLSVSILALESPAGRTLAEDGEILVPAGIFLDGEPCCYGRPSEARLRREIEQRL